MTSIIDQQVIDKYPNLIIKTEIFKSLCFKNKVANLSIPRNEVYWD